MSTSRHRRRIATLGIAVTILMLGGFSVSGAETPSDVPLRSVQPSALLRNPPSLPLAYSIPPADPTTVAARAADGPTVEALMSEHFGARFGGYYRGVNQSIDPNGPINLLLIDPITADAAYVQGMLPQLGLGVGANIYVATVGQRALDDTVMGITALVTTKYPNTPFEVGPVTQSDSISVGVPPGKLSAIQADVKTAYGSIPTTFYDQAAQPRLLTCDLVNNCDPPLRGGQNMAEVATAPSDRCTSGFFGRSNSDNKLYVITAGHCVYFNGIGTNWYAFPAGGGTSHVIGPAHSTSFGGPTHGDAGLIEVTNNGYWNSQAYVIVYATDPSTTQDFTYYISQWEGNALGDRMCFTGRSTRTHCGTVIQRGVTSTYCINADCSQTVTIANNAVSSMTGDNCGAGGDSGAPIYNAHSAKGLMSAGGYHSRFPAYNCVLFYTGIIQAQQDLNVTMSTNQG